MEPKQQPPYPLRMPPDMRSHFEDLAEANKRSLNAEIVAQLSEVQRLRDANKSLQSECTDMRRSLDAAWKKLYERRDEEEAQVHKDAAKYNLLIDVARAQQLRHRDLAIFFNMYHAVVKAAVEDGRIDAGALNRYSPVFELIERVLSEEDGKDAPAEALTEFLRGATEPLVAAAMRSAFDEIERALDLYNRTESRPTPARVAVETSPKKSRAKRG